MRCRLPAENGVSVPHESDMPLKLALEDEFRIHYLHSYLEQASSLLLQCRHAQGTPLMLNARLIGSEGSRKWSEPCGLLLLEPA